MEKDTMNQWETTVRKQLKQDNIYDILSKANLEGITVKPFYFDANPRVVFLPKIEENTHLVSNYSEQADENVFAFLLEENIEDLEDKTVFINNRDLAEHLSPENTARYFCLVDCFDEKAGKLNDQLVKELLAKDFSRNICVDIALHQNAGAAIYQQLGIALAKTRELAEKYGAEILHKIIFRIAVGANYFFEIAKIRALKIVFMQLCAEYAEVKPPYIFAETSLRNKSKADEENNLIRSTLEIAAAMIGGADAVYANDFRISGSSPQSEEVSFKQQIVLAYESIVNIFEDSAAGSYYIEDITKQFCEKSWSLFLEIEEAGGYLTMLQKGVVQQKIFEQALEEQKWVEEGKIKLVGVNLYPKLPITRSAEQMYSSEEIKQVRWSEQFE